MIFDKEVVPDTDEGYKIMPFVREISYGSRGWNTLTYTDETKYIGYTTNNDIRNGLGTLYAADGSILKRGEWLNNEFTMPIEDSEYDEIINKFLSH